MTRWLLAAEADKIQDFLFRSSRLAQVAGGSAFLARFCQELPGLLGMLPEDVIINAGGSFRLLFDSKSDSKHAGRDLAEAYYRAVDGSLTIAKPAAYESGGFKQASEDAEANLRRA